MEIEQFTKIEDAKGLNFRDIWKIYDNQFEAIRNIILNLGSNLVMEKFGGSTSKVLKLSNKYTSNQTMVFLNGVALNKDLDYKETATDEITLLIDRKATDTIQVAIINSKAKTIQNVDTMICADSASYNEEEEEVVFSNTYAALDNVAKVQQTVKFNYNQGEELLTITCMAK